MTDLQLLKWYIEWVLVNEGTTYIYDIQPGNDISEEDIKRLKKYANLAWDKYPR